LLAHIRTKTRPIERVSITNHRLWLDHKYIECQYIYGQYMAASSGIQELKTPYRVPQANGACERFIGSLRRECLDHIFIHQGRQLQRVVQECKAYYNQERPHQGIGQRIPAQYDLPDSKPASGRIVSKAILGGLHHSYARAAYLN
jgi:putative transposase